MWGGLAGPIGTRYADGSRADALHAHSDHAAGLAAGAPCPVYASGETWALIHRFPIRDRRQMVRPFNSEVQRADFWR